MGFRNFILGIGIFVVFALMLGYGLQLFLPGPEWGDYCESHNLKSVPLTEAEKTANPDLVYHNASYCLDNGGNWSGSYCDYESECRGDYENVRKENGKNVFLAALIVGVIVLVIGYLVAIEPVGSALIASGIWSIFYGSIFNWDNFSDALRFGLLVVAFILLIWLAVRSTLKKKKRIRKIKKWFKS